MRPRGFKGTGPAPFWYRAGGFTLIEMVIVLAIIAILSAILLPTLTKYVVESKIKRAQADVQHIGAAIGQFHSDTEVFPVSTDFSASSTKNNVDVLKGPGNDPTDHTGAATGKGWLTTNGTTARSLDDLKDQIITNLAKYPTTGSKTWNGPYLSELRADPFGNAYLVNVKFLQPAEIKNLKSVFVLSAGPNGTIDTPYEGTAVEEPVGDDLVYRIK